MAARAPPPGMDELARRLAERMARLYSERTPAAANVWLEAMQSLTVNPAELAAQRADVWFAKLQEAYRNKIWQSKLSRVSLDQIKSAAASYGRDNFATNTARKGAPKYAEKASVLARTAVAIKAEARAIPKVTIEDSLRRVRVAIERWKAIKGTV
ncbi:MAG: hypothetical protein QXO02_08605 [Thermofilaceae archaeon]